MVELRTTYRLGMAASPSTVATLQTDRSWRCPRLTRTRASAGVAAALLFLAGCSAHLMESVGRRLPGPAGELLTSEHTERARKTVATAVQTHVVPAVLDRLGPVAYRIELMRVKTSKLDYLRDRVERVRARLVAAAAGTRYADAARAFAWESQVIEDNDPNAFALPGGKIGVNTGLLKLTRDDDAELAAAIGHELVHALGRHVSYLVTEKLAKQLEFAADGLDLNGQGLTPATTASLMAVMGLAHAVSEIIPFKQEQELEADRDGTLLMARAGYDPEAAVRLWEKRTGGASKRNARGRFLTLHPPDDVRIAQLRAQLPEARQYYRPVAAAPVVGKGAQS